MKFPWWSGIGPIINWIKNHQLSNTVIKSEEYKEVEPFLSDALKMALKLEELTLELDGQGNMDIKEWANYDKELETLVTNLNVHMRNNLSFAMPAIKYENYSQKIVDALNKKEYLDASELRYEQIKTRDSILLNWIKYYLDVVGALGKLDRKETDEAMRYLEGLKSHLEDSE